MIFQLCIWFINVRSVRTFQNMIAKQCHVIYDIWQVKDVGYHSNRKRKQSTIDYV